MCNTDQIRALALLGRERWLHVLELEYAEAEVLQHNVTHRGIHHVLLGGHLLGVVRFQEKRVQMFAACGYNNKQLIFSQPRDCVAYSP